MHFQSMIYTIYLREMSNNLLYECAGLFQDVLTCGLRGEGRRDWEIDFMFGLKKNHMITLESIELSFLTYIIPLYT